MEIPTLIYGKDETRDDKWSATPTTTLLHRITQRDITGGGTSRWIAVIEREGYLPVRVALGDPKRSTENALEIPKWLLMEPMESGYGEELMVKYEKAEKYKKAKHLVFRALSEPMEEEYSLEEFLEQPLSELGILEEGQCIRVPILDIPLVLEKVEPEGQPVFLDGLEVGLEILWLTQEKEKLEVPELSKSEKDEQNKYNDEGFDSMLPMSYPGVSEFYSTGRDKFKGVGMRVKSMNT